MISCIIDKPNDVNVSYLAIKPLVLYKHPPVCDM